MIYLYLFGTCFHFIYVFMIYWKVLLTRKVLPLQARGGVSLSCVTQKTE